MEYKSPLDQAYGPEKPSENWSKDNRYSPYGPQSSKSRGHGRQSHSDGSSDQDSFSQELRTKYCERYKPSNYPKELTSLFEASNCRLCVVELSSPVVAKMHYGGKQHHKKIQSFLREWCVKTGNPMPEISEQNSQLSGNSLADYCELCDVRLNTANDKLLHYSGKQHQKNERDPMNAKKKRKVYNTPFDMSGRFGIGSSFSSESSLEDIKNVEESSFVCKLCDVKAISQGQLDAHLNGKKHKEKFAKKELAVTTPVNTSTTRDRPSDVDYSMHRTPSVLYPCTLCNISFVDTKLLELHLKGKRHAKNLEKRELEGADRCEVCNVTFTSLAHYQAHIDGKKHQKRSKQAMITTINKIVTDEDRKVSITCRLCPFVGNLANHNCDQSLRRTEESLLKLDKYLCQSCHMPFDNEEEYNEHRTTRRHLLCVLNYEEGDKIVPELQHWYCLVCKKQCRHAKEYTDHLFEPRHITLSQNEPIESKVDLFQCTVCNLFMDREAKEEHMRDRKHLLESLKNDIKTTIMKLAEENISSSTYDCSTCGMSTSSFVEYSKHLLDENHMERMIDLKLRHLDDFKIA